uniref:C-type lectin domain-containing protein n=1 Tax=Panagrolaimus davidi TaxID=227884 RepID=A0A914PUB5_9BILA
MLKFLILLPLFIGISCESDEDYDRSPINNLSPAAPVAPIQTGLQKCPNGWRYLSEYNKCLKATPELPWHDAEAYCVKQGAHLMSIHSTNELEEADKMVNNPSKPFFWIGLYRDTIENTMKFTNGDQIDYIPWIASQLNISTCTLANKAFVTRLWACELPNWPGVCQIYLSE